MVAGDDERHPGHPHATWQVPRVDGRVVLAAEGDPVGAQDLIEQLGKLGEPVRALPGGQRRDTKHGAVEAGRARAGTDPEYEAPARYVVEGSQLAREADRVPEVRRRYQDAELDP